MISDLNTPCDDPRCGHPLFAQQPREDTPMHPDKTPDVADKAPTLLYRVTLEVEIDVVSADGFGGASEIAANSARRILDSSTDRARVTGVKLQP